MLWPVSHAAPHAVQFSGVVRGVSHPFVFGVADWQSPQPPLQVYWHEPAVHDVGVLVGRVARGPALAAVRDGGRRTAARLEGRGVADGGRIEARVQRGVIDGRVQRAGRVANGHSVRRIRTVVAHPVRAVRRHRTVGYGRRVDPDHGPVGRSVDEVVEVRPLGLPEAPEAHAQSRQRKRQDRDAYACAIHQKVTRTPMARGANQGITRPD